MIEAIHFRIDRKQGQARARGKNTSLKDTPTIGVLPLIGPTSYFSASFYNTTIL
jgi:hypothetical protein